MIKHTNARINAIKNISHMRALIRLDFLINSIELALQIGAVIVTPTRELAIQIDEVLSHFLQHLDKEFTHMLFIGGNNPAGDVDRFLQHGFVAFYKLPYLLT